MPAEQDRLTRVELELGFLKGAFGEVKTALIQLADDMHKLALADAERAEDRRTVERMFKAFENVNEEFTRLWKRTDEIVAAHAAAEQKRVEVELADQKKLTEDDRKNKNRWLFEVVRTVAIVAASLFGIKLL